MSFLFFFFSGREIFFFLLCFTIIITISHATIFEIHNQCHFTIWAAATPGGGRQLDRNQKWTINFKPNRAQTGVIWGRTNCTFDNKGNGSCETGDCDGMLQCTSSGAPPNTLGQFSLYQLNNMDSFNLSLLHGFNLPMDFTPITSGQRGLRCRASIGDKCPDESRVPGGCNQPCDEADCPPSRYSNFFKENCPDAYSDPSDEDPSNTLAYPSATNYKIVFCPVEPLPLPPPQTIAHCVALYPNNSIAKCTPG